MSLLDKIKDTANKAAEGVQKAAESGQEKIEESKLKKKVGDLKEELGGIVFAQRTGTAAENAEAVIPFWPGADDGPASRLRAGAIPPAV